MFPDWKVAAETFEIIFAEFVKKMKINLQFQK